MFRVNACPKNQTEVEKAGKILGCGEDIYGHNQYMCLPNKEKTSHYEFCYKGVMGIENGGISFFQIMLIFTFVLDTFIL